MTKKHFIALAVAIKMSRSVFSRQSLDVLCSFCQDQNPRFNRDRWLNYIAGTCGPNGGKVKVSK